MDGAEMQAAIETWAAMVQLDPGGGTADGVDGAHILLAPPYIIRDDHLRELCARLRSALDFVLDA